jgi:ribosome-associated translation inhibitor RaiA
MNDENKNKEGKPGNEFSDKADELFGKGKDIADKAEDFITDKFKRFKKSDAFGKLSDALGKVEEVMEQKSQEFQSGEMGAKFEAFRDKAEVHANDLFDKIKEASRKIGDQVDDSLDAIKGKKERNNNQNGGGI